MKFRRNRSSVLVAHSAGRCQEKLLPVPVGHGALTSSGIIGLGHVEPSNYYRRTEWSEIRPACSIIAAGGDNSVDNHRK